MDANSGMYDSISNWDLSCADLDCQDGNGKIYGVPIDFGSYGLFYNKSLLSKAGVATPPTTFDELLAACDKLKASGIIPIAYGDRDGYSTDNWVTWDVRLVLRHGRRREGQRRQLKYSDPKLVQPLEQLDGAEEAQLRQLRRQHPREHDANSYFTSGKAAMVQMYPFVIADFEKALGKDLGVTGCRRSAMGRWPPRPPANSFHNWVIPKKAKNPDLAFEFIKIASDQTGGRRPGIHGGLAAGEQGKRSTASPTPTSSSSPRLGSDDAASRCSTA